jgi:hypothetical protein
MVGELGSYKEKTGLRNADRVCNGHGIEVLHFDVNNPSKQHPTFNRDQTLYVDNVRDNPDHNYLQPVAEVASAVNSTVTL